MAMRPKKLFEDTIKEITQVLNKRADQAKGLAKDAEKSARS